MGFAGSPGSLAGESEPIGFYTTIFIEASSASEAELAALKVLRAGTEFELVRPEVRMENAQVYFEQIEALPVEAQHSAAKGFTFFFMDT